jgi:hypothetical protein
MSQNLNSAVAVIGVDIGKMVSSDIAAALFDDLVGAQEE